MKAHLVAVLLVCAFTLTSLGFSLPVTPAGSTSPTDTINRTTQRQTSAQLDGTPTPSSPQRSGGRGELSAASLRRTLSPTAYLPLVFRPHGTLYGKVSENGVPIAGITVTLVYCKVYELNPISGIQCSDAQALNTTTDEGGMYRFFDMPTLIITGTVPMSQTYQVQWANSDNNPNRLRSWATRELSSYTLGDVVNIGDFDLGGVSLIAPQPNAVVSFPVTFRWTRRANVPSDSYSPCIWGGIASRDSTSLDRFRSNVGGPSSGAAVGPQPPPPPDIIWCGKPLGYVDSFVVAAFAGVDYGYYYQWMVQVYDQAGGSGETDSVFFQFSQARAP